jgi:hypothetical protein
MGGESGSRSAKARNAFFSFFWEKEEVNTFFRDKWD